MYLLDLKADQYFWAETWRYPRKFNKETERFETQH